MGRAYRINSPCSADWNRMSGDDLVRYCPECQRHVHNLIGMQPAEIEKLFADANGRICGRLVQPAPVPNENSAGNLRTAAGVLAALVTITAAKASAAPQQESTANQKQSVQQVVPATKPATAPQSPKTESTPQPNSNQTSGESPEVTVKLELAGEDDSPPPMLFADSPTRVTVTAESMTVMGSVVRIGTNPFRRFFNALKRIF